MKNRRKVNSDEKLIDNNWSEEQLDKNEMFMELHHEQASLTFTDTHAEFRIIPGNASEYIASRISEVDQRLPLSERTKPWLIDDGQRLIVKLKLRFVGDKTGITYNIMLWNSPFDNNSGKVMPATTIGVTRSVASSFEYAAVITQNVSVDVQAGNFDGDVLQVRPLNGENWLTMDDWHWVYIEVEKTFANISIEQGEKREQVLGAAFAEPIEPLGMVLSVDNEIFPGSCIPVENVEGFDIAHVEISLLKD